MATFEKKIFFGGTNSVGNIWATFYKNIQVINMVLH